MGSVGAKKSGGEIEILTRERGYQPSPLEAFKENAKQFQDAIKEAISAKAAILEYTDITGAVVRRYWNGAMFVDKKPSGIYEKFYKSHSGTYKKKFKAPPLWG